MRGFTLTQPWASLVALEAKRFETRSWTTTYCGDLLIHAAKNFPRDCQELCAIEPFLSVLKAAGYTNTRELPTAAIVAYVPANNVIVRTPVRTELMPQIWAHMRSQGPLKGVPMAAWDESNEHAFGDYGPNRYAWPLPHVRKLREPIPCKGALGLWTVPQVVLDLLAGQGVV